MLRQFCNSETNLFLFKLFIKIFNEIWARRVTRQVQEVSISFNSISNPIFWNLDLYLTAVFWQISHYPSSECLVVSNLILPCPGYIGTLHFPASFMVMGVQAIGFYPVERLHTWCVLFTGLATRASTGDHPCSFSTLQKMSVVTCKYIF